MWSVAIFAAYRLLTALPVLRWPFWGGVVAILGDLADLFLLYFIGSGWNYQQLDKYFDLFYFGTFAIVAWRWRQRPTPLKTAEGRHVRRGFEGTIAIGLLVLRMAGLAAFETTAWRPALFIFPNVFEFWFLTVAALHLWKPEWHWTVRRAGVLLLVLTILKLGQEYLLHVWRPLDRLTIIEFLDKAWRLVTPF